MLKNKYVRPTRTALFALLLAGGLLLTHSARAVVQDSLPAQPTPMPTQATLPQDASTPKKSASASQSKVSPYARMNREHAQARAPGAASATTASPPPTVSPAARKGKSGVAKKN